MDEVEKAKLKLELRNLRKARAVNKHSVNFYLLLLIIILLVAMIGATMYFFWRHGAVLDENKEFVGAKSVTEDRLNECKATLQQSIDQIGALSVDLNTSSASRQSLNQLYASLSDTKTLLETNLTNAVGTLNVCRLELVESKNERDEAIDELDMQITRYTSLWRSTNVTITGLRDDIGDLELQISLLEEDLDDIRDCVEGNNCTACEDL